MKLIPLSDVLKQMDSKKVIDSISFVTAHKRNGTGGEIINLKKVVQTGNYNRGRANRSASEKVDVKPMERNPEHYKNQTRNLIMSGSSQTRKCHIRLITEFNGKQVIW